MILKQTKRLLSSHLIKFQLSISQKQIEEHKPTPAQIYARKHNIMQQKFILNNYKMLQSRQSDSRNTIEANYIRIKEQLNNRHFYIPNKKQYLIRIDQAYEKVMEIHPDYNFIQIGKEVGYMTKQDVINHEIETIRKILYLDLLNTYDTALVILIIIFLLQLFVQKYSQPPQKLPLTITNEIEMMKNLKSHSKQLVEKLDTILGIKRTPEMELQLLQIKKAFDSSHQALLKDIENK